MKLVATPWNTIIREGGLVKLLKKNCTLASEWRSILKMIMKFWFISKSFQLDVLYKCCLDKKSVYTFLNVLVQTDLSVFIIFQLKFHSPCEKIFAKLYAILQLKTIPGLICLQKCWEMCYFTQSWTNLTLDARLFRRAILFAHAKKGRAKSNSMCTFDRETTRNNHFCSSLLK